jgi:hypothetical protein
MNDWSRFKEKWFNESQITFADYEFDIIKQELLVGFDELTEDFDRAFNDDSNEMEFSESYMGIRIDNVRKDLILLLNSYPSNPKSNKNTKKNKTRKSVKPKPVQRRNRLNSKILPFTVEKEGKESFEDVIVTDGKI